MATKWIPWYLIFVSLLQTVHWYTRRRPGFLKIFSFNINRIFGDQTDTMVSHFWLETKWIPWYLNFVLLFKTVHWDTKRRPRFSKIWNYFVRKETLLSVYFFPWWFLQTTGKYFYKTFLIRYLIIYSCMCSKIFKSLGPNFRDFLASLFDVAYPLPSPED